MPLRIRSKGGRESRIGRRGKGITYRRGGVIRHLTCPICFEDFDDVNRQPQILMPCGHTICSQCAKQLQKCPLCRSRIDKVVPNYLFTSNDGDFVDAKFADYTRPCVEPPLPRMCDPKPREPAHRKLQSTLVASSPEQKTREEENRLNKFKFKDESKQDEERRRQTQLSAAYGPHDPDSDDEDYFLIDGKKFYF